MLSFAIPFKSFEVVARWYAKVIDIGRVVDPVKFALRPFYKCCRERPLSHALEDVRSSLSAKDLITSITINVIRQEYKKAPDGTGHGEYERLTHDVWTSILRLMERQESRNYPGQIRDAILQVLALTSKPLPIKEIENRVRKLPGQRRRRPSDPI